MQATTLQMARSHALQPAYSQTGEPSSIATTICSTAELYQYLCLPYAVLMAKFSAAKELALAE